MSEKLYLNLEINILMGLFLYLHFGLSKMWLVGSQKDLNAKIDGIICIYTVKTNKHEI